MQQQKGKRLKVARMYSLPTQRDAYEYLIEFQTIDLEFVGKPEGPKRIKNHTFLVGISGTLAAMWSHRNLDKVGLEKTLFELARRQIVQKIKDGTLTDREELQLGTSNAPTDPPFEPKLIPAPGGYQEDIKMEGDRPTLLSIGAQVADALDNINALFYERNKGLLFNPREFRASLEFIRPAETKEDFSYRVASLSAVINGLNASKLRELTEESNPNIASIGLLEKLLNSMGVDGRQTGKPLRDILTIRKAYPIHSDSIEGVVEAHGALEIEYPVTDFAQSWEKILQTFLRTLKVILKAYKKSKGAPANRKGDSSKSIQA